MSDEDSRGRSHKAGGVVQRPSQRPAAPVSERPPARNPSRPPPALEHPETRGSRRSSAPPPMLDHLGQVIELGEGGHGRLGPEPPAGWPAMLRLQAVVALLALLLEAVVPGAWLMMLAAVGCLGYSLQTLPQTWIRPGPLGLGWGLVLGRAAVSAVLPICYELGGANTTFGAVVLIVLLSVAAPVLVPERPHHLSLTRAVGADVDAFGVAVLSALLHGSGQVGAWVLFAGALRFLHILALVSSRANMNRARGPAAFFQPLTLLMLGSGLLPMPLLYVPVCALATIATALIYGRLTLRHAG